MQVIIIYYYIFRKKVFSIKVNNTVWCHNPQRALIFCMKGLPPGALITRALLVFPCSHAILQLCYHEINSPDCMLLTLCHFLLRS